MTVAATAEGRHKMGPVLATFHVAGNMIGSGVFLLPATLATIGSVSIIGWVVTTLGALLLAAIFSLLARVRPAAGGLVAFVGDGLGRFFGFEAAFGYWLTCTIGNVAIALAVVGYLSFFIPALKAPLFAAAGTSAVIWLLTLANIVGPRFVGRMHGAALLIGLLPIAAAAVLGWLAFDPAVFRASWNVSGHSDIKAVGLTLVMVFWAFLGLETGAVCARVVRNPERNVPIATFGGVALAAIVYLLASAAVMGVLPAAVLAQSAAPFADVVARIVGAGVAGIVAACAIAKASGTLGGWILVTAETNRASAEAGFLPRFVSRSDGDGPPVRDLIVLASLMTVVAFVTASPTIGEQFGVLINVSTNLALAVFALSSAALFRFAGGMSSGRGLARAVAVAGVLFCVGVIAASEPQLLQVQAWLFLLSLPLWALIVWNGRRRGRQT